MEIKVPFSPPDITGEELSRVAEVMRSGWITTGAKTREFEEALNRYCGTNRVVCLNSATAAMELTLRLLGIGPGDEVITTPYTYTASAAVILHVGATPVFVDLAHGSTQLDLPRVEAAITARTKAILPVDVAGVICDYPAFLSIAQSRSGLFTPRGRLQEAMGRIAVIADAAHSFGASRAGKPSGSLADFSCFSFHAVKNLTTGEGGAVTWNPVPGVDDDWIYRQFQLLSLHGQDKTALDKAKGGWEYDILTPGYKCNMTDIAAAIGLGQLARFERMQQRRYQLIQLYEEMFAPTAIRTLPHFSPDSCSSGHLFMTWVPGIGEARRGEILTELLHRGIAANVHFKPLPLMTAYQKLGYRMEDYPNAYQLYQNEITLPLYSQLSNQQALYCAYALRELGG